MLASIKPAWIGSGFTRGEAAIRALPRREGRNLQLAPGARAALGGTPQPELSGVSGLTYLSAEDVTGRLIERYGGAVAKVLFYRLETPRGTRGLMVHVTSDGLITDYDLVEK